MAIRKIGGETKRSPASRSARAREGNGRGVGRNGGKKRNRNDFAKVKRPAFAVAQDWLNRLPVYSRR
ncbi:hypothetical protein X777_12569 [Ooceraea biroi]|uniref:Uncharacterized protein n=1 Tax=Ooceraea biroi TaxID=2015173 RepID=A0A026W0P9_OOCBI|nr:hypothetical protein X777_12569 [Ooceraea biroi]